MTASAVTASAVTASAVTALRDACDDIRDAGENDAVDGVRPALVAHPASTEAVAAVLGAAAAHGLAVVPRGRGTKLSWGMPPTRLDLVVDVARMDRVLDHAAGDLVVVAQAGALLSTVQATAAEAGQRLAVDETVPGASIGGTVATATSGPGRVLAGTVRDLLIGVTVVRADGVVAKAGGRVVKNVAGYDLGKLVTGSFGTLAVVTETVFRLHPLPTARRVVSVAVAGPDDAHRLVQGVLRAQVVPSAVEVDWPAEGPGTVAVLLEGIPAGVEGRTSTALHLLGGASADASEDLPPWWGRYPWATGETAVKLTFALSGLPRVLADARETAARHDVPLAVRGSAGAGVLYGALPASCDPAVVAEVVGVLRATCAAYGGSVVVVDAPARVKESVDVWGPVPAIDLMRRVKDQFDPGHRLSPGRFVGGI
jgi:glycolate oxidase FAD binding subunit